MSVSLDFLEILGRRKKNKISQGGVWADLTPPFVTEFQSCEFETTGTNAVTVLRQTHNRRQVVAFVLVDIIVVRGVQHHEAIAYILLEYRTCAPAACNSH